MRSSAHAQGEIVHAAERPFGAGAQMAWRGFFAQPAGVAETEAQDGDRSLTVAAQYAEPFGLTYVHRQDAQAVALGILDQDGRGIEAHGLVVQHGAGEGGQVVALQIGAGVGQQGETGGVRFGESVEREGGDGADDIVLRLAGDAIARHAGAQFHFDIGHALFGALEAHGAAQLLGLAARESGGDHGHAQQLLLK